MCGRKPSQVHLLMNMPQKTIKETFSLQEVPKEALYVGLAGVVPYLATSLSTVFLAWDMNHAAHVGYGFIFSEKTASMLLHIIEPLQIGYGAVVSFSSPSLLPFFFPPSLTFLSSIDHLLPRCHPLGSRVGQIRRRLRI